ncbi:hypothetical protein ['Camptotheca acuminata' phytoplasma]|uniref:hypothetical protein n=1 Tax='Camptotheca acuminata' phytoplasma TaxID=3239192 RepID=UPI00351A4CCF
MSRNPNNPKPNKIKTFFSNLGRKKIIIGALIILLLITSITLYFVFSNKKNTFKVNLHDASGKLVKQLKIKKNTKITDDPTNKQSFEELKNANRWVKNRNN